MTYIYLITYTDGSLYVGSHTWDGPEGILDPNYHGSSRVAKRFNLKIKSEEILEVLSEDRKLVAEREWIEYYAALFGISDKALSLTYHHKDSWRKKFPSGGRVINLHANDAQSARDANRTKMIEEGFTENQKRASYTSIKVAQRASAEKIKKCGLSPMQKEAVLKNQKKSVEDLKLNGPTLKKQEHGRRVIIKAREVAQKRLREEGQTPQQRKASLNAIKSAQEAALLKLKSEGPTECQVKAYKSNNRKRTVKAHTAEAMSSMVSTRKLKNSYITGAEKGKITAALNRQKDSLYGKPRIVKVLFEGKEYVGAVKRVCADIGFPNWSCTVSKKFKTTGSSEVVHNGVLFITFLKD